MSGNKDLESATTIFWTMLFIASFITLVIGFFAIIPLAVIFGSPVLLLLAWLRSPKYQERQARKRTLAMYEKALRKLGKGKTTAAPLTNHFPGDTPESVSKEFVRIGRQVFDLIRVGGDLPEPPIVFDSIAGARFRDQLIKITETTTATAPKEIADTISQAFEIVLRRIPRDEGALSVKLSEVVDDLPRTVEQMISVFADSPYFSPLMEKLEDNLRRADWVMPREYKGDDVVGAYLRDTPLAELFECQVPIAIPESRRFEHTHVVAQIGHGKTQTLQFLIAEDLKKVADNNATVIVIDSQGELIRNTVQLSLVSLTDVVWINPRDIDYPPALNLFDHQNDRISSYSRAHQEQLTNATIELYEFIMGGIFGAELTSKQGVAFRYVIRLILTIPQATIQTLLDVFQHPENYQRQIDDLGSSARSFFDEEFNSQQFRETRKQVVRRIYTILENRALERMFSAKESKLDLFTEMNAGKLILIDTAKDMLKEEGATILGRFFLAKIVQAAQERAAGREQCPVYVYVDEAQDYFDEKTEVFLSQLRKHRVGGTFAHQYLDQIPQKLLSAFMANTATKIVGGVSLKDARAFAGELRRSPEEIANQDTGTFMTMIRGTTRRALPIRYPFFVMERMEKRSKKQMADLIETQRFYYGAEKEVPKLPEPSKAVPAPPPEVKPETSVEKFIRTFKPSALPPPAPAAPKEKPVLRAPVRSFDKAKKATDSPKVDPEKKSYEL